MNYHLKCCAVSNLAKAVDGVFSLLASDLNKGKWHVKLKDMKENAAAGPSMKYVFSDMKSSSNKVKPDALTCVAYIPSTAQFPPLISAQSIDQIISACKP